jgi:shikimate kinase
MMGSGKSTTGQILADALKIPFQDLDHIIEHAAGMSVPEIFKQSGEEEFRQLEHDLLLSYSQHPDGVIALGGGALQNQNLLDHIKSIGWLIYLEAPAEVLFQRLQTSEGRPMLAGWEAEELYSRIDVLLKEREPLYRQAQITIKTGALKPQEVVQEIIQKLNFYDAIPPG